MPQVKCKICQKVFHVKPCYLKLGYGKYCSRKCLHASQRKGKYVLCDICGKKVWKIPKLLKQSKSGKFFCGKSCQTIWRNKEFSGAKHPNWQGGAFTYTRVMREHGSKPLCSKCGYNDKRVLVVHHKDRDRKHNDIQNLTWLCRNCHYLIHLNSGGTF